MTKTVLLIHGDWLTPASFDKFRARYQAQGYRVLVPAWPGLDRPAGELFPVPGAAFARLTLGKIVDHYARIIETLPEKPILIGHSYGGLVVQMLLDRGYGAAGVAIDPAPAAGIIPGLKAVLSSLPVFLSWAGWSRALTMSFTHFARNFAQKLPEADRRRAFEHHIVPAPGRLFYQSLLGIGAGINWMNGRRAPLLLIAGTADRTVEPGMVRRIFRKYTGSKAVTEMHTFPGRSHFLIAEPGWEKIAEDALAWARARTGGTVVEYALPGRLPKAA